MSTLTLVRRGLRAVWQRPRVPDPPPVGWRDGAAVAVLAGAAVAEGALRPSLAWPVVSTVLTVAMLGTLLLRRHRPLTAVVLVTVAGTALELCRLAAGAPPDQMVTTGALIVLPYSLFRWGSGRAILIGSAVLAAGMWVTLSIHRESVADIIGGIAVLTCSCAVGEIVRGRRAARQREIDRVRSLERARIARDLHDTVAHHVTAIAVRAQGGRLTADRLDGSAAATAVGSAFAVIDAEAREALQEMRAVVRLLREDESSQRAPEPPARHGLPEIVALAGEGPLPVGVTVDPALGDLAPATGAALYRIAQEAVTNARRHAKGATGVTVVVAPEGDRVRLRVSDDGAPASAGSGFGLLGMTERADLLGGTCQAGPTPGGGWQVVASLPLEKT